MSTTQLRFVEFLNRYIVDTIQRKFEQQQLNPATMREIRSTIRTVIDGVFTFNEQGLITRQRSEEDERKVTITLTPKGKELQTEAASIPEKLVAGLVSSNEKREELQTLKDQLYVIINHLSNKQA